MLLLLLLLTGMHLAPHKTHRTRRHIIIIELLGSTTVCAPEVRGTHEHGAAAADRHPSQHQVGQQGSTRQVEGHVQAAKQAARLILGGGLHAQQLQASRQCGGVCKRAQGGVSAFFGMAWRASQGFEH